MATEATHFTETIKSLLNKITKKTTTNDIDMIFIVPGFIADKHHDLYKPKMVPIGPYHDSEEKFKAIKERKLHFVKDFMERNKEVNLETYFQAIEKLKDDAHACYSEIAIPSDKKFVQMLLFDGCFILELLLKLDEDKHHCHRWAGWDFMAILSDLLLIENQIPFFILEELYTTYLHAQHVENTIKVEPADLKSLAVKNLFVTYLGVNKSSVKRLGNNMICHLLHLYHEVSLPHPENKNLLLSEKHRHPLVIPSATQLVEFGFVLKKHDSIHNSDVTIKHNTIKIPRLIIDSTRRTILMNLLAFEQNVEWSKRSWTGLMVMMNCMIKNNSDLEILRSSGIVLNLLSSEDEAVLFFRQLSKRVTIEFNDHYYYDLFEKVNKKCDDIFRKQRAAFMHEYFNNRWAVISFCSSIIAILLSTVQTLVSVFTYRAGYFDPLKSV